jgi:hypothetical protein
MTMRLMPALAVALGLTMGDSGQALAKSPEKVFKGQIITSTKHFPTSAKSPGEYIKKIKKAKATKFKENKETKSWKVYFAAFFRVPLNDLEVTVKLYDISSGRRHLITSFEQYTEGRGQKTLISHVKLEREYFGVNKKILMTMETRKSLLAQGTFHILGEAEKLSGSVDFTDDE